MKIALCILLFLGSTLLAQVNKDGDVQSWNYGSIEQKIKKDISLRYVGEVRFGDDLSTFYFTYFQTQGVLSRKGIEVAPGYRQEFVRLGEDWQTFCNPLLDVTFFSPTTTWQLDDRTRIICQIPERGREMWIYRNRLRLTSPELTSCYKLKAFIDDEVFFREDIGFSQNRLSGGLFATLNSHLKARLFYIYRQLKQGQDWTVQHVFVLHLFFYPRG